MSSVDIFNQLTNQYTGSITNIQAGSLTLAQELFNNIALISVGLLGITHLLRRNVDLADTNIELIKWLIYLNIFYLFITHYGDIYPVITNFFQQIANYLGAKASISAVDIKPGNIISIGYSIAKKILFLNLKYNLFRNFLMVFISIIAAAVVMYCFAAIGLELILVQIGSQIILAGGIFLLAFSGLQWTKDYAERYVHSFFHLGIKIIFIYILVGIGVELSKNWTQILDQASLGQLIDYDIAVCMSTFVYYKLCLKLPDQAVSYLTGRMSMGFDTASSVNAAIKTVARIPAAVIGVAAGMQGMGMAVGAATGAAKSTLSSEGRKENVLNTGWEAIRTLGEANREVKQEAWSRKVNDTQGGKIAKNILSKIPKEDPDQDPKEDLHTAIMGNS